eukprot:scaffold113547_cov37-Prasinocladus_malaysianus.AAC.1
MDGFMEGWPDWWVEEYGWTDGRAACIGCEFSREAMKSERGLPGGCGAGLKIFSWDWESAKSIRDEVRPSMLGSDDSGCSGRSVRMGSGRVRSGLRFWLTGSAWRDCMLPW